MRYSVTAQQWIFPYTLLSPLLIHAPLPTHPMLYYEYMYIYYYIYILLLYYIYIIILYIYIYIIYIIILYIVYNNIGKEYTPYRHYQEKG